MKKSYKLIALLLALVTLAACGSPAASSAAPASTAAPASAAAPVSVSAAPSAAPANRLEEIKARGTLTVVMEPYFSPNEFIDPSKKGDDQYVGSDVEMAKYIANKLGVKLQIVPLDFTTVLSSITEGKYDLAISALAYTPLRAEAMNMSKGYYFSKSNKGYGILIRTEDLDKIKGPDDLADKIVVAQSGSIQEVFVNEQVKKYKEFKRVSSTTDGYLMVTEKKADAATAAIANAELYIQANKDCGLSLIPDFKFYLDPSLDGTRVGITKGEDELTAFVNECIDELVESGQYEKWYEEYSIYAKSLGV